MSGLDFTDENECGRVDSLVFHMPTGAVTHMRGIQPVAHATIPVTGEVVYAQPFVGLGIPVEGVESTGASAGGFYLLSYLVADDPTLVQDWETGLGLYGLTWEWLFWAGAMETPTTTGFELGLKADSTLELPRGWNNWSGASFLGTFGTFNSRSAWLSPTTGLSYNSYSDDAWAFNTGRIVKTEWRTAANVTNCVFGVNLYGTDDGTLGGLNVQVSASDGQVRVRNGTSNLTTSAYTMLANTNYTLQAYDGGGTIHWLLAANGVTVNFGTISTGGVYGDPTDEVAFYCDTPNGSMAMYEFCWAPLAPPTGLPVVEYERLLADAGGKLKARKLGVTYKVDTLVAAPRNLWQSVSMDDNEAVAEEEVTSGNSTDEYQVGVSRLDRRGRKLNVRVWSNSQSVRVWRLFSTVVGWKPMRRFREG